MGPGVWSDGPDTLFRVRLQPRASRTECVGLLEDHLRIRVTAPALEHRANRACIEFVAERLGISPRDVSIESGAHARNKIVRARGVSPSDIASAFNVDID